MMAEPSVMTITTPMRSKKAMSRPHTPEECRQLIFDHMDTMITSIKHTNGSLHDRLNLLAFIFFAMLDGHSPLPSFLLIPAPHHDDEQYCIDNGENYWPHTVDLCDGELHSRWANRKVKTNER
jgi:hypothetical protein